MSQDTFPRLTDVLLAGDFIPKEQFDAFNDWLELRGEPRIASFVTREEYNRRASLATPAQAQQAGEVVGWALMDGDKVAPPLIDRKGVADILANAGETVRPLTYADTPPAPAQPAAPPTKVANPYSGVGQVSEGWCRANPGLAAMAINRLSAWLNELQQDQAAGPPPTPPAQQGEPT